MGLESDRELVIDNAKKRKKRDDESQINHKNKYFGDGSHVLKPNAKLASHLSPKAGKYTTSAAKKPQRSHI